MCGIAGVYLTNHKELNKTHVNALHAMMSFMKDRGPDGNGIHTGLNYGLVHTRLSIIDVNERSNQPMESEHWVLSFNGEIVNYRHIRSLLTPKYTFKTESDTEVLLLAIEEWGIEKALPKCTGMFTFLAYNKVNRHFFAARDPMGIKPLFYYQEADEFWFASTPATIKAAMPQNSWQPYKPAIASYFALGAPFTKMTTTTGINQIAPASYLSIAPNGDCELKKYWTPQFQNNFSMNDLTDIILEYQNSDVKSALFLSGGIDSSFLATVIPELDFFHLNSPELSYAKHVAKTYKKPLVVVNTEASEYINGIKKVSWTFGEPFMSCGIPYCVANEVVKKGYKMAISANGADELFLGYPRTPLSFSIKELNSHDGDVNKWFDYQIAHIFRNKRHFHIEEYDEYIPSLSDISLTIMENCTIPNFDIQANYRWIELMTYVLNDLNPTLDAASMANSLEVRVPFLDHRIVQGVLSWPAETLYNAKLGRKAPLKEHLLPIFGSRFIHRPKLGFSIDKTILATIHQQTENEFLNMLKDGFIELNPKPTNSPTYDRDMVLLKPMCQVFRMWKEESTLLSDCALAEN